MKCRSYLLCAGFLFVSCKKHKLKEDKEILSGNCNWIYTEHSYGWCQYDPQYETIFAADTSVAYSLDFSEKGKVTFIENGVDTETDRLVFEYFESDDQAGYFIYIKLDNKKDRILEGNVSGDTLRVNYYPFDEADPNCENYLNFFVRV